MLKTDFVSVHTLFSGPVQFVIPVYQRHYVWNEEEQWEPLWQDIIETIKVNAKIEEAYNRSSHFTGAIVTRHLPVRVGEVPRYEIIDGQQRLTTFQIILCAIADVCREAELTDNEGQAAEYLMNGGLLHNRHNPDRLGNSDEAYKVIPTKTDIDSFKALIDGNISMCQGAIRDAYVFFKNNIKNYMRIGDHRLQMIGLTYFFLHNFGVAQILITTGANSERIFESVNARGRTINEFDHLRNNIFLKARVSAEDNTGAENKVQGLYKTHWQHFEDSYWTKRLGPEDEEMLLSERFVKHFLMAKLGKSSIAHRDLFSVYEREYRADLPKNQGVDLEFRELEKYSKVYQVILDCKYGSETCREFHSTRRMKLLAQRMEFYKALNVTGVFPFILYMINELDIPYNDLDRIFDILESYTIRRLLVSNQGARNYNAIFAEVIKRFRKTELNPTGLLDYLSSLREPSDRCPNNEAIQNALAQCGGTHIGAFLTRYILYRIELAKAASYRTVKGPLHFGEHLTLEHVMPIKWQRHWPLPNPQNARLANERDRAKQSIGNLTLLTKEVNGDLGNLSFADKRGPLLRHSDLEITKEIVYENVKSLQDRERWDVADIRDREEELSKRVCEEIWPFMPVYSGELKNWHPSFEHGFIIDANGKELPVDASEFNPSDIAALRKGTQVKFEKAPIESGFKAVNVVRA